MRITLSLTAFLLLAPAPAASRVQTQRTLWTDTAAAPRGDALLKAVMLERHNATRKTFGAAPLVWNDALAARAKTNAETIARTRNFAHDPQTNRRPRDGENLFMGTAGAYRYDEMVALWIDERADFVRGKFPNVSRTGDWSRVGHYTQMVWPGTREVGCAVAANKIDEVLVCRYSPAGNVMGIPLG
jgi:Cysteine-rich secretory protein family